MAASWRRKSIFKISEGGLPSVQAECQGRRAGAAAVVHGVGACGDLIWRILLRVVRSYSILTGGYTPGTYKLGVAVAGDVVCAIVMYRIARNGFEGAPGE